MIEINIYVLLAVNIAVSVIITLGTSYLKEIGKNLALKQMKGKLTEIDENIKRQFESKDRIEEEQKNILLNFHTECNNLIFQTLKLHDNLYFHIFIKDLIPQIDSQITRLNTSISSMSLFFDDEDVLLKANDFKTSLLELTSFRKDSILEYNYLRNYKEDRMQLLSSFNTNVIDKDSQDSIEYKNHLSNEISKLAESERKIYEETPDKLKGLFEKVIKNKSEFEIIVRKKILKHDNIK